MLPHWVTPTLATPLLPSSEGVTNFVAALSNDNQPGPKEKVDEKEQPVSEKQQPVLKEHPEKQQPVLKEHPENEHSDLVNEQPGADSEKAGNDKEDCKSSATKTLSKPNFEASGNDNQPGPKEKVAEEQPVSEKQQPVREEHPENEQPGADSKKAGNDKEDCKSTETLSKPNVEASGNNEPPTKMLDADSQPDENSKYEESGRDEKQVSLAAVPTIEVNKIQQQAQPLKPTSEASGVSVGASSTTSDSGFTSPADTEIVMVGNKSDLEDQRDMTCKEDKLLVEVGNKSNLKIQHDVTHNEDKPFVEENGSLSLESSPKMDENVEALSGTAAKNIQDSSLDLNAVDTGVQHNPIASRNDIANDKEPSREGC